MKIIEAEEANQLVPLTGGRETAVSGRLKMLKPGQALIIERGEWKAKYAPTRIARYIEKKYGWKFSGGRLPDASGWILQRVE